MSALVTGVATCALPILFTTLGGLDDFYALFLPLLEGSEVLHEPISRPLMDGSTIFQRHLLVRVVDHLALVFERDVGQFVKPVEGQRERVWDAIHTGVGDKIIVGRKIAAAHG